MTRIINLVNKPFSLLHQICLLYTLFSPERKTCEVVSLSCYAHSKIYSLPFSSSLGDLRQMGRGGVTEILPGVKRGMKQTTSTVAHQ